MKNLSDVISGVILLIFCAVGAQSVATLFDGNEMEQIGPGAFPAGILVLLSLLSVALIIRGFLRASERSFWPEVYVFKRIVLFFLLFYFYLLSLQGLDSFFLSLEKPLFEANGAFCISTFTFLLIALPLLGRRSIPEILGVATCTTATLVVVFGTFFKVLLP